MIVLININNIVNIIINIYIYIYIASFKLSVEC
jgi:hypothetical protein